MAVFYRYDYTEITKNIHPCIAVYHSRQQKRGVSVAGWRQHKGDELTW